MAECKKCKIKIERRGTYIPHTEEEMSKLGLCFTCYFWHQHLIVRDGVIINGRHHIIGHRGEDVPASWRGCGGRYYKIQMLTGKIIETVDLWCQGMIPALWRPAFPDNAILIEEDFVKKNKVYCSQCGKKYYRRGEIGRCPKCKHLNQGGGK